MRADCAGAVGFLTECHKYGEAFVLSKKKTMIVSNIFLIGLVSPETKDWDYELIKSLGYPGKILQPGY